MAGNKKRSSFSFFSFFKGRSSSSRRGEYETKDDMNAYKVYPSDEDGRWVAEPRIDEKASAYITHTTDKWGKLDAD
ncbi:hypothetical protein C2S51_032485 [Perilla frutescens var. frutescens]|nr:hypothetical protein C2S51_032485 [Perilla frutescens var. frutescens]